jgi:hypothetical protein
VTFSVATAVNPYYTAALSPAVAALLGVAVTMAWSAERATTQRDGAALSWPAVAPRRIGLAAIVAGTAAYAAWLVPATGAHGPGGLVPAVIAAGAVGAVVVLAAPVARGSVNFAAALGVALASVLVAPGVASADLVLHHEGALDTPFEPVRLAQGIDDTMTAVTRVQTVAALRLEDADDGAPDLLATQTSAAAAEFIYATGREVLPIGGFTGTIPSPTLSQLQADVRAHRFRVALVFSTTDPRTAWIATNCLALARPTYVCDPPDAGVAPIGTSGPVPAGSPVPAPAGTPVPAPAGTPGLAPAGTPVRSPSPG